MSEWLRAMGAAVGNHLWQSTAFAAVAWGLTLALRRNPARVRYGVWLAASVKFLVPFSLLVGLGGLLPKPRHVVATAPVSYAVDTMAEPFSEEIPGEAVASTHVSEARHGAPELVAVAVAVAGVWFCGVVVVLGVWWVRWRQVARTLRRAARVEGGREWEILQRVQEAMGGRGRIPLMPAIPLLLSRELMEPGMFGMFRPVLIWPARLSERLEAEHIEAILAHELMHARRRDNLTAGLHMFVEAAFWFHPMVWWMERRMVEERERACDEAVVEMGSRPGVYAESLLKACRFCVESPLVCVAGITGADLAARVRGIMTPRLKKLGVGGKVALAAFGFTAVAGPIVLGQMKGAQRMMLAAVNAAPKPLRAAAHAMIALEETPSTGLIAKMQTDGQALLPRQSLDGGPGAAYVPTMTFDVASVRETQPDKNGHILMFVQQTPHTTNLRVSFTIGPLLNIAYGVDSFQIVGAPNWPTAYTIEAKGDADADAKIAALPPDEQRMEQRHMLQALLEERFKLKTHWETKEGDTYNLVVAKGGPKLGAEGSMPPSAEELKSFGDHPVPPLRQKGDHGLPEWVGNACPLGDLASILGAMFGRPVTDKTALAGKYDFVLKYKGRWDSDRSADDMEPTPPLDRALQDELGLKVEPAKGPVKVLAIDHIEKPTSVDGAEVSNPAGRSAAQAVAPGMRFEVATIKLRAPVGAPPPGEEVIHREEMVGPAPVARRREIAPATDRWHMAIDTKNLIASAYGLAGSAQSRIVGGPDWLNSDLYEMDAKIDDATVAAMQTMAAAQRMQQMKLMEQVLLADRFGLKAHFEMRELPEYALVVAKGGPRLTPAKEGETPKFTLVGRRQVVTTGANGEMTSFSDGGRGGEMNETAVTMAAFVRGLPEMLGGRVLVDQTGLTGTYDFTLKWGPDQTAEGAPQNAAVEPPLFTAITQQLGLKLVETKGPVDVLVIDHVERPSEN